MTSPPPWSIGVVIPAHDEALHVGGAIGSVLAALDRLDRAQVAGSTVVVVADSCRDETARLAREALGGRGIVVDADVRCVGAARAAGTAAALALLAAPSGAVWLANTDADSVVPAGWLEDQLALADAGAECVAGLVGLADGSRHLREVFGSAYARRISPTLHGHVHGANLGIRADLLDRVGGWPALTTGEDRELWERAGRAGAVRRTDPGLVVLTSARLLGRAPDGFARDLRRLAPDRAVAPVCLAPGAVG